MFEISLITNPQRIRHCVEACEDTMPFMSRDNAPELLAKIQQYAVFLEAAEDGKTVGYCAFYANDSETRRAYISLICILKEKQKMKYGRQLLDRCIEESRQRGMKTLRLEVLDDNLNAIGFYKHCGFTYEKKCSETSSYYLLKISD